MYHLLVLHGCRQFVSRDVVLSHQTNATHGGAGPTAWSWLKDEAWGIARIQPDKGRRLVGPSGGF